MNFLEIRTVLTITVITDLLCTLVLILLWHQNWKRFSGTFHWVVDYCFQTVAMILVALRGSIPDLISMVFSNALVVSGALLGYIGLCRFLERKTSQVHNYILLALFVCVHFYFTLSSPDLSARNINLSFALLIICFQCAWLMFRRGPNDLRMMKQGTGIVFVGFCLVSILRLIVIFSNPQTDNDLFRSGQFHIILIVSYQLLMIAFSYSLILMVNSRLIIEIREQEEKFSKAFRSTPYAITITRLSDSRIIEVNDGFVTISGYRYDEVVGKTTNDLQLWKNEGDCTGVANELSRNRRVRETEYHFRKKNGDIIIGLFSAEIIMIHHNLCVLSVIIDMTERKHLLEEREKLVREQEVSISQIKILSGLLPICTYCKKIRDDKGYWNQIEAYIRDHSEAEFSHSICRECAEQYYPNMDLYDK